MCNNLLSTTPAVWILLGFLLTSDLSSQACADEVSDAVAAIKKIGGTVRPMGKGLEIAFHLRGQGLTDKELIHVAALKNVTWLNLRNTKITSAGLVHLKGLKKLRTLHLEKTKIDDEGIKYIAGLPNLEYLNLYGTKVTDKSLEQLTGCKNLRRLYVWQTKVTDAGVARLKKTIPDLKIVRGVDLSKLAASFPKETEKPKPRITLKWVAVSSRDEAPKQSVNGVNCEILFENKSAKPIKLQWISYDSGALKYYATLAPGAKHPQNSYSRNAWLITDENDKPLGYFTVEENDSHAVIPSQK